MNNQIINLSPKKQIVVVKGWEGFADRLQVLSHCIEYCKKTGATICVDWRDCMWGQSTEDFHDYFKIIGIPSIPITGLLDHIQSISSTPSELENAQPCEHGPTTAGGGVKIFPPAWTVETLLSEPCELFHFPDYENEIIMSLLKICAEYDILVHNGKGERTYHSSNLINNIRFQSNVCDHIQHRLLELPKDYTAIHLRGTDRLIGETMNDCIANTINNVYVEYEGLDSFDKQRVFIVTDMDELRNEILARIPNAEYLPNAKVAALPKNSKKGRHMLQPNALEYYGIKKSDLILDALTDFMILCLSDTIISNQPKSLFYEMADLIRKYGGNKGKGAWLGGARSAGRNDVYDHI